MYLISNDHYELSVNKYGSIDRFNLDEDSVEFPAYFVFFKEYSRLDPSCKSWNIESQITDVDLNSTAIAYRKIFSSPDGFEIEAKCSIEVTEHGIKWNIVLLGKYPQNHRFGVTVPFNHANKTDINAKPIKTPISVYGSSIEQVFPDQTLLSCPLIVVNCETHKVLIMGDIKDNIQFFCYEDSAPYVRLTTLTSYSNELELFIRTISLSQPTKQSYIQNFPDADFRINKWRYDAGKSADHQNVELLWKPDAFNAKYRTNEIKSSEVDDHQLFETYSDILINELNKYPPRFLSSLNIRVIILCGALKIRSFYEQKDIKKGTVLATGFSSFRPEGGHLYLDVNYVQRAMIHHEIFHFMARKLSLKDLKPFYNLVTAASMSVEEHWCDLFAATMTDMRNVIQDIDMKQRIHQLKNMVKETFDFDINPRLSIIKHEATIYAMDDEKVAHPIPFGSMPEGYKEFTADVDWYHSNTD